MASDDSYLDELIQEIVQLFQGQQSYNQPVRQQTPGASTENLQYSPSGFQAPIHGTWYNLGGFTLTSPNPRHPHGHMGLDMSCSGGTPVYAAATGVVSTVGTDPDGGNVVGVTHSGKLWTYYAHMSTVKVQKGDRVTTDTILGTVGNTGNARGGFPHLHFGVKERGAWVDPARFFSVPKYNPDYAKNPTKYVPRWASEQAQEQAIAFNMKDHLAQRRATFTRDVNNLLKTASSYYQITKKL